MKEKKVTVTFIYPAIRGKDEQFYKDKAFDEIYNSDDNLDSDAFLVEDYEEPRYDEPTDNPKCPRCGTELEDAGNYKWNCPCGCFETALELWQMKEESKNG